MGAETVWIETGRAAFVSQNCPDEISGGWGVHAHLSRDPAGDRRNARQLHHVPPDLVLVVAELVADTVLGGARHEPGLSIEYPAIATARAACRCGRCWSAYPSGPSGDRLDEQWVVTPLSGARRSRRAGGRRFVGRAEELQLFRGALAAPGVSFTVLFFHGLGGIGKSALLGEFADLARAGRHDPDHAWLREQPLPALPGDAVVVVAGRTAPTSGWLSDPGLHKLFRVVSVRNLRPEDRQSYLRIEGVQEAVTSRF